jgi:ankyrin repeat protein
MLLLCQHYRGEMLFTIIKLLLGNSSQLNVKNNGCTPIYLLCRKYCEHQFLHTIELLVNQPEGQNVNTRVIYSSALIALSYNYLKHPDFDDAVRLLVERGANINALDIKRQTVLIIVCTQHLGDNMKSFTEIVRLLVKCGADINAVHSEGRKAVEILVRRGFSIKSEIDQMLLHK